MLLELLIQLQQDEKIQTISDQENLAESQCYATINSRRQKVKRNQH